MRPPCLRKPILVALLGLGMLAGCDGDGPSRADLVWGIRGSKAGWLMKPRSAAFGLKDELYIADLTDRIQVFDRDGGYLRGWRMPKFDVDGPSGLTVDRYGRLLIADTHFYRVLVCTGEGTLIQQVGDGIQGTEPGRFGYPIDVEIDKDGNFFVLEYGENDRVQVFSPEGRWLRQWGGHGYEPGEFMRPRAMTFDDQERLFVADSANHRIQVFDKSGKVLKIFGGEGDGPGRLKYPYDLAIGPDKSLYVCEYGNHRVQKFTLDGKSLGTWGGSGRLPGQLYSPWSLAVDRAGEVSVIDTNNHRVQRFRL